MRALLGVVFAMALLVVGCRGSVVASVGGEPQTTAETCDNRLDDDGDGAVDCLDPECQSFASCIGQTETCGDAVDNDLDGLVDCADSGDCALSPMCSETCGNGVDDNGDTLVDCADPVCKGIDPSCGEVCGDGMDNDGDGIVDCLDSDCVDVIPPCGGGATADGTMCAYGGVTPHVCACADGIDNDTDGTSDSADLQCFGPFDDDESSYATGIPGDNNGSKGNIECPFDGNSGPGNDGVCCNPADPSQNVTPNGCDSVGCCEIDINGNGTGEHAYISGACEFAPACAGGAAGTNGCPCAEGGSCGAGLFCVADDDTGVGFCTSCEPCTVKVECDNPCSCGEICFGGFRQPVSVCGGGDPGGGGGGDTGGGGDADGGTTPTCPSGVTVCPNGNGDCNAGLNESCSNGCCYATCPLGVTPCQISSDCPTDSYYICVTGCCIESV